MKGDLIPEDDNVVRYVRPGLVDDEEVSGGAFVLRDAEPSLSISWFDYFRDQTKNQRLSEVRRLFRLLLAVRNESLVLRRFRRLRLRWPMVRLSG